MKVAVATTERGERVRTMGEFNLWTAPALTAAALMLGSVIYIAVRWRRHSQSTPSQSQFREDSDTPAKALNLFGPISDYHVPVYWPLDLTRPNVPKSRIGRLRTLRRRYFLNVYQHRNRASPSQQNSLSTHVTTGCYWRSVT